MLYSENFNFIEIEIIRSHVYISFQRVATPFFEFNVLSYVHGTKIIKIEFEISLELSLPFHTQYS